MNEVRGWLARGTALVLVLVSTACSTSAAEETEAAPTTDESERTQEAQEFTDTAAPTEEQVAESGATRTPRPGQTPLRQPEGEGGADATTPTARPTASPPPALDCTYDMTYVTDVTVPDGAAWPRNSLIEKVWRVRNTGTCAWNADQVALVEDYENPNPYLIAGFGLPSIPEVEPGGEINIGTTYHLSAEAPLGSTQSAEVMFEYTPSGEQFGDTLVIVLTVANENAPTPGSVGGGSGSISGKVWADANGNGLLESGERGISPVLVMLQLGACSEPEGSVARTGARAQPITAPLVQGGASTAETDAGGNYSFLGLQPGTYCVGIEPDLGISSVTLGDGRWTYPYELERVPSYSYWISQTAAVGAGAVPNVNFGWQFNE